MSKVGKIKVINAELQVAQVLKKRELVVTTDRTIPATYLNNSHKTNATF
jgi:hypothetical protein